MMSRQPPHHFSDPPLIDVRGELGLELSIERQRAPDVQGHENIMTSSRGDASVDKTAARD